MSVSVFREFIDEQSVPILARMLNSLVQKKGAEYACHYYIGDLVDSRLEVEEEGNVLSAYTVLQKFKATNEELIFSSLLIFMKKDVQYSELYETLMNCCCPKEEKSKNEELTTTDRIISSQKPNVSEPPLEGDTHEIVKLTERIKVLEQDNKQLRDELELTKRELIHSRSAKEASLEENICGLASLEEKLSNAKHDNEALRKEMETLKKQIAEEETEKKRMTQMICSLESDVDEKKRIINHLNTDYSAQKADFEHRLIEVSKERDIANSELTVLQKEHIVLKQNLEVTANQLEENLSSLAKQRQENAEVAQKLNQMQSIMASREREIQTLEAEKDKLNHTLEIFHEFLPSEAMELIEEIKGENENWLSVFYAFLVVIMHHPVEDNDFLRRFTLFDIELYDAFKENKGVLERLRNIFQDFLNKRLEQQQVRWDMLHTPYNEKLHSSDDRQGNTVLEVITALVTGPCSKRALVRTMEETK